MEPRDRKSLDISWIQHLRKESRTAFTLACPLCKERRVQPNDDALWDHTLAAHPEDVPPDDGEARDSFRKWLRTEATSPRPARKDPMKPSAATEAPPVAERTFSDQRQPVPLTASQLKKLQGKRDDSSVLGDSQYWSCSQMSQKKRAIGEGKSPSSSIRTSYSHESPQHSKAAPVSPRRTTRTAKHATGASGKPRDHDDEYSRPPAAGKRLFEQDNDTSLPGQALAPSSGRQKGSAIQHQKSRKPPQQSAGLLYGPSPRPGGGLEIPISLLTNTTNATPTSSDSPSEVSRIAPQPETRPISQEQLVAEVKGIYAGLVMVEGKCIQVDLKQAALARDAPPGSPPKLNHEQWQALIALHRTLLHEHHDFFLASQHPSATPAVRRLANKYAMPARLWRHGIHSFLELLRNRLPESMDHMLAFIYLAYSMMTLLYETVPAFEETWIECLGDLGRYRMAIEDDDIRDREVWTQVARQWYLKASDRSPQTGRLYHHLAILARPNALQQLYFYGKAVSVPHPFAAAKDSMVPFFQPFLEAKQGRRFPPAITAYIKVHAYLAIPSSQGSFTPILSEFTYHLDSHIGRVTQRFLEQGYYIAITNCIAILAYGSPESILFESLKATKGSVESNANRIIGKGVDLVFGEARQLFNQTAEIVLQRVGDPNILGYMHVLLIFMVHMARFPSAMSFLEKGFPWQPLVMMLNALLKFYHTHSRIEGDTMPIPEKNDFRPTPEEFAIHGLFWADTYFPPGWFSNKNIEDENQYKEEASMNTEYRPERILWLGCRLARSGEWISYKDHRFFVSEPTMIASPEQELDSEAESATVMADCDAEDIQSYASRTSTWASEKSEGEELIWNPAAPARSETWESEPMKDEHMETEETAWV